ncbi:probable LRR receptor-like serine/threonine-protein kinase At3g47570 [Gossypium raimondii]|uniref:probable LRR receptor-like serine/threonine-protein kinase At3g47570 n=1 Tax=Gossypium raimondii TaxID=29730 RepID=UPI00227D2CF2|nr:probable LRR receptor-like serine/threonine-protein kinase At3g47570 [Gossypium raimondii]
MLIGVTKCNKNGSSLLLAARSCMATLAATWRLTSTETLELSNNSLSGEIPSNLSACSMLTFVHMRSNQLKGEILASLGLLSNLINLRFYNNSLTGTIPPSLGNLSSLKELHLALNGLTGNIPETLVRLTNLSFFSIGENVIFGIVPVGMFNLSTVRVFDIGDNKNQAVGWNKILGRISDGIENLINLEVLEASGNELSGYVPFGVGRLHKLKKFYADSNFLSGIIPHSIGNLTMLMELALDINNLQGDIPSSLSKCQNLLLMGLSNNILSGPLPGEVIGVQSLSISLDLSSNYLTENLGRCVSLEYLFLDANLFEGSIPSSWSLLRGLEALNVSDNNISGGVPKFLKERKKPTTCPENSLLQLSYESILRATNEFSAQNLIGSGSFGFVYKGILEVNGEAITVNVFNLLNHGASRSFLDECEAFRNIRHRNLVKVLTTISGVDYQGNDFKALVYKFMENGSLEEWLHPSVSMNEPETVRNLNFIQRVNIAIDVAHALEYLHHCCETSIIHCDLKPCNILLDKEMVGHLSDFGLAKILSTDRLNYSSSQLSSLGLRGTIGYAPPEYAMGSELSTKGDVYSYGILLLEMFIGKRPTDERFKEDSNLYKFLRQLYPIE